LRIAIIGLGYNPELILAARKINLEKLKISNSIIYDVKNVLG
jgi:hypothetical protein